MNNNSTSILDACECNTMQIDKLLLEFDNTEKLSDFIVKTFNKFDTEDDYIVAQDMIRDSSIDFTNHELQLINEYMFNNMDKIYKLEFFNNLNNIIKLIYLKSVDDYSTE